MVNYILSIVIAFIAMIMDIKFRKINNTFLLISLLLVIVFGLCNENLNVFASILGMLAPLVVLFIPFCLKCVGAGDIKLLCVLGYALGIYGIIDAFALVSCLSIPEYIIYRFYSKKEYPFVVSIFSGLLVRFICWMVKYER